MKLAVAATLLAQCVPALPQTLIVQDLGNTIDHAVQPLHRFDGDKSPSIRLLSKLKDKAKNRHARNRALSQIQGVLKNGLSRSLKGHPQCDPTSTDPDTGILSCGEGLTCRKSDASDLGGFCQATLTSQGLIDRRNRVHAIGKRSFAPAYPFVGVAKDTPQTPCDPSSPDVGILSCQEDELCKHDESSALGGICVQTSAISRSLYTVDEYQSYCDPTSTELGICDCSGLDTATGTGSITCMQEIPFGTYIPGCDGLIAYFSLSFEFTSSNFSSGTQCYAITAPEYQKGCFTKFYTGGATSADSCTAEFNGQECSSCAITDDFYDFDCSAIDPNVVGGTRNELLPILGECATGGTNGTSCVLCSEGYAIPATKYGVFLPIATYEISCGDLAIAPAYNFIPEPYCSSLAPVVQEECCEATSSEGTEAPAPGPSDPTSAPGPSETSAPEGGEPAPAPDGGSHAAVLPVLGAVWSAVIFSTLVQLFTL